MNKLDFDMLGKIHEQDTVRTKYFCEDETLRDNSFVGITKEIGLHGRGVRNRDQLSACFRFTLIF